MEKVKNGQRQLGSCGCPVECSGEARFAVGDIEMALDASQADWRFF